MKNLGNLASKTIKTLRQDGVKKVCEKTALYMKRRKELRLEEQYNDGCFRDVLFVNGCNEQLPHPGRYRVSHQREQLESLGWSTGEVYYQNVELDSVRCYRSIVFFRCPYTEKIGEMVQRAKALNKTILYDVDDLVFDTCYTDQIPYLNTMPKQERQQYDEHVKNMGKLLKMCDGAITTTKCLAEELKKYVPNVLINRNVASEEMVKLSQEALNLKETAESRKAVRLGYFSGSITHNDDFQMILPVLIKLLEKYQNLELWVVGELELPEGLEPFADRIGRFPFSDWKGLPKMLAEVDINLAPLCASVFNEAKSENKWMEAALVKVPTVASKLGAFLEMVQDGKNGLLCENEKQWEQALEMLIQEPAKRRRLGNAAYDYCMHFCTTMVSGTNLDGYMRRMETPNIMFLLPGFQVSGGVMVALQHVEILQKSGRDVTLLSISEEGTEKWYSFEGCGFPVLNVNSCVMKGRIDWCVATMWSTCRWLSRIERIGKKGYLVQNYEPDFYEAGDPLKPLARETYGNHTDWEYLTISRWCEHWLQELYGHKAAFAPNGFVYSKFAQKREDHFGNGEKIRILIEGDSSAWHKNVDESFRIVNKLDPSRFEIWYMAYHGKPKDWYHVDRFLPEVPYEQVQTVYGQCDILLKSSLLESFSYPPLEMMASGGLVTAVQNDGNKEYLRNEENCLIYEAGDEEGACQAIWRLCEDQELRDRLRANGRETAKRRDWEQIRQEILNLYPVLQTEELHKS